MSLRLYAICLGLVTNLGKSTGTFSPRADHEHLLNTRERIINDLHTYIIEEERKLSSIKRLYRLYKEEHEIALENISYYLNHPINVFTLTKRLTTDLDHLKNIILSGTEYTNKLTRNHDDLNYPSMSDLSNAAQVLLRLQVIYNLSVEELAQGTLSSDVYTLPMTSGDCYELGKISYGNSDYLTASMWMIQAFQIYNKEKVPLPFNETDIFENLLAAFYRGHRQKAQRWIQNALDNDNQDLRHMTMDRMVSILHMTTAQYRKRTGKHRAILDLFTASCRGELDISPNLSNRLVCRLLRDSHPFLKIAPYKIEMLHQNPDVILFHDVLSHGEIEYLKRIASPSLIKSIVHGERQSLSFRDSKSAVLRDNDFKLVARITHRVRRMTGLNMHYNEPLQVTNYGVGGHYGPHHDSIVEKDTVNGYIKLRIATVMFYMSDVTEGGATVFPELGLRVLPVKGTALFWFNMHKSGKTDKALLHGACPFLRGTKWVANKWIAYLGQEFTRPCEPGDEAQHNKRKRRPILKNNPKIRNNA
ncbi:prolyl 4-hydroxylase subunit alpha-2-like [Anticarsia gemmatalis]|uniref:prolyl 4-hydroxylase subunit alpha-2-like n=1 Tax=Anticarsia gemmatalis TaxID=129554 RepID=UPI003F76D853